MRLLLDTHIGIWLTWGSPRLSIKARSLIEAASTVHISIVSLWEVAIKQSLPRKRVDPFDLTSSDFARDLESSHVGLLAIELRHVEAVEGLPRHHRDPFDRLIVAQALEEPMRLLTADRILASYGDLVILA